MNLTPSSAASLGEAFRKIVELYTGEEDQLLSTDFYFQPLRESGKLAVFNDNDLSFEFNYSNSYLSKLFRDKYNVTPKQYAKQLLLKEAVVLLGKGLSVCETAERLEFSSPENFSRFFKGYYGYSPSQYIKKFKNFPI